MPRRVWHAASVRHVAVLVIGDLVVALLAVWVIIRDHHATGEAMLLALLAAIGFVMTTALCRGYLTAGFVVGRVELQGVLRVTGVLACVSLGLHASSALALPLDQVFWALLFAIVLAVLLRLTLWGIAHRRRRDGRQFRRTLLVGPAESLEPLFAALEEGKGSGLSIVGICSPHTAESSTERAVLGDYDAVPDLVRELDVEAVAVATDAMSHADLRRLGWSLHSTSAELILVQPLTDIAHRRLRLEPIGGTPLLSVSFDVPPWRRFAKAAFDRTVGAVLLLIALPVILGAGLVVRLTSRGPAFFVQTRIGVNGEPFSMYKLRTMFEDAEKRLAELKEHNDGNGMLFKMREDPRVTPIGRTLRRFSIDELPQLWNVVKGDMSLVGPRPALPREVAEYDGDVAHRLRVRPGLTGLWQVSGRSNLSADRSVRLDLRYADNWTVTMDLTILYRTARAVVIGDGAY